MKRRGWTDRNLIPDAPVLPSLDEWARLDSEGQARLTLRLASSLDAITKFLTDEHPRNRVPLGPVGTRMSVATQSDGVRVAWEPENSGAAVDFYLIYRAAAGTAGTPTTPLFSTAVFKAMVPGARLLRGVSGNVFEWFDLELSAADRLAADKSRFRYWIVSIDNEGRLSPPIPAGYGTVPPPEPVGLALYAPGSFTIPDGSYAVMTKRLQLTGTQRLTVLGNGRLRIT